MEKIRIITDSGADIPQGSHPLVRVLPMPIRFGDEEFLDGVSISTREFYERLIESDELPTTSQVNPAAFSDAFKTCVENGEKAVVVCISSKLSGTHRSALLAAQDFPGDVFVVDSLNVAVGEQVLVWLAVELVKEGLSAETIAEKLLEEREKVHVIAVLDTLEYLQKGGRISKTAALLGGALAIKPVVTCRDGEVAMLGKARGSRNGNNYLIKEIESTGGVDFTKPVRLGYTGLSDDLLRKYITDSEALWAGHARELKIAHIGATIGTHIGPGAIAVGFFEK